MQIEIILNLTTGKPFPLWECCFWCWGTLSGVSWGHFACQIQAASSSWSMWLLASDSVPSYRGKIPAPGMAIVAPAGKPGLSTCMENSWRERRAPPSTAQDPLIGEPKSSSKDNPRAHLGQTPSLPPLLPPTSASSYVVSWLLLSSGACQPSLWAVHS